MTDWKTLCSELLEAAEDMTVLNDDSDARFDAVAERARAALAQPLTISAARIEKKIPDTYRLVTKEDGNGNTVYALQGYFTWTQGWDQRGGEWRDLETQDWLTAQDDIPFGPLF